MAGATTEKLVEEWLHRQGFFTIRQLSKGVGDIDIVAIKWKDNKCDCRHYEVQGADNPMGHIVPFNGAIANERNPEEMDLAIRNWINDRFQSERKVELRNTIADCEWTYHFVLHNVRYQQELQIMENLAPQFGLTITRLKEVRDRLQFQKYLGVQSAEKDLVNLTTIDSVDEQKRRFVNFLTDYVIEIDENSTLKVRDLKSTLRDHALFSTWLRSEFAIEDGGNRGSYLVGWRFKDSWQNS